MSKSALYNYHEDYCSRFDSKKSELQRLKLLLKEIDMWERLQQSLKTFESLSVKLKQINEVNDITPTHCEYEISWLITHYATNFCRNRNRSKKPESQFL